MARVTADDLKDLSFEESLELAEELWDRLMDEADTQPISDAQPAELDRRWAEYEADPDSAEAWEVVRARLFAQFGA